MDRQQQAVEGDWPNPGAGWAHLLGQQDRLSWGKAPASGSDGDGAWAWGPAQAEAKKLT